jgi:hypothetical protein
MSERERKLELRIKLAYAGFRKYLFFNRLLVKRFGEGHVLARFGLVIAEAPIGEYACVLTAQVLETNKKPLTAYYSRLPTVAECKEPEWTGLRELHMPDAPQFIYMAQADKEAEIALFGAAVGPAAELAKKEHRAGEDGSLPLDPIAVLRSDLDIHKRFLELILDVN